ncbi:MAG: glycine cleavage system protein T, partial [Anaerolineae bacterium]|nr:glycine cleavage system protein T [Anaerolineae bacterium]
LPLHHWRECQISGVTAYLHRTDPLNGEGYFVMCQMADRNALWEYLVSQGLVVADEAAFDFLRIEAGMPRYGRELTLDYIPLEADLWADVSFHKGCYTGQEIIARMESRGKLAKRLTRLQPETLVQPGDDILQDGKKVGTYTSVAEGPTGLVALGYVKTNV